ncbi:uncharacterized protein BX664DRAFT_389441 [Halteromyces radiatus]|uniref:uncharacterized protein n=1 Tax=Halteromyces radiatus TaxID=101107 RepID=UPI00222122F7|nr:uncharacterized protein BX664DRAFT_389441 [Halteromyces radiatus]KAI8077853.1 hypothetical protein BX664DRAFT_389441 [Halteromyces radiatus]
MDNVSEMDPPLTTTTTYISATGKIKKKPGRKPNPASPALRKAQNRAAQKAFRERKERHMKELEGDTKRLLQERNLYYNKSQTLAKENDILKCENWYLKGIVLSLQLVCFKNKLRIPRHTPYVDEKSLEIMSESAPASIATYLDIIRRSSSPAATNDDTIQDNNNTTAPSTSDIYLPPGHPAAQQTNEKETTSPVSSSTLDDMDNNNNNTDTMETDIPEPIMLRKDVVANNMAAIQTLRLRLRLQSAFLREKTPSYAVKPTLLQLTVPHDSRIDLLPTVHMRDRMILFRDQFDLDDCLRLLVNEAVFHGGDPSVSANWELPAIFFEKYWFLTIDYTLERTSLRWRKLKSMMIDNKENTTIESTEGMTSLDQPMHRAVSSPLSSSSPSAASVSSSISSSAHARPLDFRC